MDDLKKYKDRLGQLHSFICDPSISNQDREIYSIEISELSPLVTKLEDLEKTNTQIKSTEDLINNDNDTEMLSLAKEELSKLEEEKALLEKEIEELTTEKDPDDKRNVILEIRAGSGGEESALFASELYRMYLRFAENKNWVISPISTSLSNNGGFKEIICSIEGQNVYGFLKYENGVHRVQRIPATESSGRIHTSAVSVVVIPEVDDIEIEIDQKDLEIDVYRSSGPGGQSVNTTDSAVRIKHIPTGIVVTCQDEKSQHKNKARALKILKSRIYDIEKEKQLSETSDIRRKAIKSGDRSAKVRTYNFPQNRVTDHRISKSWHNIEQILDGSLNEVITSLAENL